jgi:iron complex transport system permease protein
MMDNDRINKDLRKMIIIVIIYIVTVISALIAGRIDIGIGDIVKFFSNSGEKSNEMIALSLRMPRIIAASLVGAALSVSGACYQSAFNNPLVAPDMLGVSSGACVGASLSILLNLGSSAVQIFAFLGGLIAVGLSSSIPKIVKNEGMSTLVLAGIITTGLFNSVLGMIKYLADPETELPSIVHWQLGSMKHVSEYDLLIMTLPIIICLVITFLLRWSLNIISLGEDEARTLGLNVKRMRSIIIIVSTMLTASSVCLTGTISWIGLVIPHFARLIFGYDNRKVIPMSIFLGAGSLVFIDTLARSITTAELPISIFTGLIGAPFYFFLLYRQYRKSGR